MDEQGKKLVEQAGKRYLERFDKFDDLAIGKAWVKLAKEKGSERITTRKGLTITVKRSSTGVNKVAYTAFLEEHPDERVAWMHCMSPIAGRVQVSNANVYDIDGIDYRRQGIGTAIYDLIEHDVRAAGADGLEPHWGSMSEEAIEFWKQRRPDRGGDIADLNRLGAQVGSWLFD